MDPNTQRLLFGAAGAAGGASKTYIEDVFSSFLYTGNGSTQTITNGIDLAGKGGLVWIKGRNNGTRNHRLFDTAQGATNFIESNTINPQGSSAASLTSFNSSGFSIGASAPVNTSSDTYASWTFRKAAKFFDVVTYTGNGSNRTIAHNLGSVPGCIIVKRTDTTGDWQVYHRSLANTEYMVLNSTAAKATGTTRWNSTTPTSTVFTLGTDATVNASGGSYVAYLFAHDAGGFGDSGNDNIISCGSYVGNGSTTGPTVAIGWEPQWLLIKNASTAGSFWSIFDNMRGMVANGNVADDASLMPHATSAESLVSVVSPSSTGFSLTTNFADYNELNSTYIYIAIRRGPMKTPTDATRVFDADAQAGGSFVTTSFPVDLSLLKRRTNVETTYALSRLQGGTRYLETAATTAEQSPGANPVILFDSNSGVEDDLFTSGSNLVYYNFRRAPGFFDVVAYTGTGSARTVNHNLGVAPELIIVKGRNQTVNWFVYASIIGSSNYLMLNQTNGSGAGSTLWNSTNPTASAFSLGTNTNVNDAAGTYIAYLFASCPGVSKIGSYTGTGTTLQINCGFTNGARFVLIKRTDSTGDWYVWDTARGIVAANDPYILLNSTAAEVTNTDYIDPYAAGFEISSTAPAAINANGGSFIYLAVA